MPNVKMLPIYLTKEMAAEFAEFLDQHELSRSVAGRIAVQRLLDKKPTAKEIESATLARGTPENLVQFREKSE